MDVRDEHLEVIEQSIAFSEQFIAETHKWERSTKRWQWVGRAFVGLEVFISGFSLWMLATSPVWYRVALLIVHLGLLGMWIRILRKNRDHLKWISAVRSQVSDDITHMKAVLIEARETGEWAEWMAHFPRGDTEHP